MRQFRLLFAMLILSAFSIAHMRAADVVVTLDNIGSELTTTANTEMATTTITATGTETNYTLNYFQCKKQGNSMFMTKSVSPFISNATAMPGNIKSVEVFINSGASGKTTYDVAFSTTACTTAVSGIGAVNIAGGNSHEFSNMDGDEIQVAGRYFCVTLGNANNGQVLKIVVTCAAASTDPSVEASVTDIDFGTVEQGSGVSEHVSRTFTLTGENLKSNVNLSWTGSIFSAYPTVITPDDWDANNEKEITVYAQTSEAGAYSSTLTISSAASTAEFDDIEIDLDINVIAPIDPTSITLNQSSLEIEAGKKATLSVTEILPADATNKNVVWQSDDESVATVNDGIVTAVSQGTCTIYCRSEADNSVYASCDVTVTPHVITPGEYTFTLNNAFFGVATGNNPDDQTQTEDDVTFLAGCKSSASTKTYYDAAHVRFYVDSYLHISVPTGYVITNIVFTSDGTWNASGISANLGVYTANTREWTGNAQEVVFSFSAQCRVKTATVTFEAAPEIAVPSILGPALFYPTTTVTMSIATDGADIIYTLNGEDPVGGDNTYTQPLVLSETTTVKARGFKGSKLGEIVSRTFTKATPISVADALLLIPNNGNTANDQFVEGYVCTAPESLSNGQLTYYISDDGSETDRLQIYKGKNINNADFSAVEDIAVGDRVVVFGQLKNYNGTPEFNSGNYLVERVAKGDVTSLSLGGTLDKTTGYEAGDIISTSGLTAEAIYQSGYREDVTATATWTVDGNAEKAIYEAESDYVFGASYGGKSATEVVRIYANTHAVSFANPSNGSLVVKYSGSPISSGDAFLKGTILTVEASPAPGYKLDELTVNGESFVGTTYTIGTKTVYIAASFVPQYAGQLTITPNAIDFGSVEVNSPAVGMKFSLSGTGFTKDASHSITLTAPSGFALSTTSINEADLNDDGSFEIANITITPSAATLAAIGVYDGNITISADDMSADSLVAVRLTVVKKEAGLAWSATEADATLGSDNSYPTLSNPNDLAIAYESSNESVATIDDMGVITLVAVGETTIKAVFAGDNYYLPAEVSYTLNVANKPSLPMSWTKESYTLKYSEFVEPALYSRLMVAEEFGNDIVVTSSNTEVATAGTKFYENSGYTVYVSVVGTGTTTFTAYFPGNATYAETSVTYTLIVEKGDCHLAWPASSDKAYTVGKEYELQTLINPNGLLSIDYSSSDESVATIDDLGNITPLAAGTTTISAGFAGNDYYNSQEVSYTLTVVAPTSLTISGTPNNLYYERGDVISVNGLTVTATYGDNSTLDVTTMAAWTVDGETEKVIYNLSDNYAISAAWQGLSDSEVVTFYVKTHKVTVSENLEHGTLVITDGTNPIAEGAEFAKGTKLYVEATSDEDYRFAAFDIIGAADAEDNWLIVGTEDVVVSATFVEKTSVNIEWSADQATVTIGADDNIFPTLSNPFDVAIAYNSSDEDVASIDAVSGVITPVAVGTATITATFAGNDTYKFAEVSYELTVQNAPIDPTGINNMSVESKVVKMIENDRIVIIKDGIRYSALGSKIR
ncbi:MAG: Ig-like domain-containing protein [Paludibacteraceae bacterium]|nr:Ig-like domain-containing protein [Paludibacteraceae bacterium]